MPAIIAPGAEVRTYQSSDGTTQVCCPACSHTIPGVPHDALTLADHRPTCTPIRCVCPEGLGTNLIGQRVICPCRAVFRLTPQGIARWVVVEGHQEPEPEATPVASVPAKPLAHPPPRRRKRSH